MVFLLFCLLTQPCNFTRQPRVLGSARDAQAKQLGVDGLGEEVVRTGAHAADGSLQAGVARDYQHRDGWHVASKPLA